MHAKAELAHQARASAQLALNGVRSKVMQELAGHNDAQTTMQIYTHVNLVAKRQAVDILSGALAS